MFVQLNGVPQADPEDQNALSGGSDAFMGQHGRQVAVHALTQPFVVPVPDASGLVPVAAIKFAVEKVPL